MDQANKQDTNKELATLGGGCFWCLEPIFKDLIGIEQVVVGYSGGTLPNPSYRQVCMGTTGHAEVVQITFDPKFRNSVSSVVPSYGPPHFPLPFAGERRGEEHSILPAVEVSR